MILALEIAEDVHQIFQTISYQQELEPEPQPNAQCSALVRYKVIDLDQVRFEDYVQEQEKMGFLRRIGSFIKEIFAEECDAEALLTPFGIVAYDY